jgi:hypothetical protein
MRDAASPSLKPDAFSVIPEAAKAALQLGETVLDGLGLRESVARDLVAERRLIAQGSAAIKSSPDRMSEVVWPYA